MSIGRPGPTIGSHQPGCGSSALLATCAEWLKLGKITIVLDAGRPMGPCCSATIRTPSMEEPCTVLKGAGSRTTVIAVGFQPSLAAVLPTFESDASVANVLSATSAAVRELAHWSDRFEQTNGSCKPPSRRETATSGGDAHAALRSLFKVVLISTEKKECEQLVLFIPHRRSYIRCEPTIRRHGKFTYEDLPRQQLSCTRLTLRCPVEEESVRRWIGFLAGYLRMEEP